MSFRKNGLEEMVLEQTGGSRACMIQFFSECNFPWLLYSKKKLSNDEEPNLSDFFLRNWLLVWDGFKRISIKLINRKIKEIQEKKTIQENLGKIKKKFRENREKSGKTGKIQKNSQIFRKNRKNSGKFGKIKNIQ